MKERNVFNRLARIHKRCQGSTELANARRLVLLEYSRNVVQVLNEEEFEEYVKFIKELHAKLFPSPYHQRNFQLGMARDFIVLPRLYTTYDIIEYCGNHHDKLNELTTLMLVPDFSQFFIECDGYELMEYCRSYLDIHRWNVSYGNYNLFLKGRIK
jgi:hypothetical protein